MNEHPWQEAVMRSSLSGLNIIVSEELVDRDTLLEDWSGVRSPARARRRRSRHRQNIRFYHPPSKQALMLEGRTIMVHPTMYQQLKERLAGEQR